MARPGHPSACRSRVPRRRPHGPGPAVRETRSTPALREPGVCSALKQIGALRGRELVDFLTTRVEERVREEVNLAEPRIRTLEAAAARLREHVLANDEIAQLTFLLQAPDLRLIGGAV